MIWSEYPNKFHSYYGKTGKKIMIWNDYPNKFHPYYGKTGR